MEYLAKWLDVHGLGKYSTVFADNDVDLKTLPHLSDDDLKELGLSLGHRRKLIAALREAPPVAATGEPQTDAERRQLTVMFCDLADSTKLSEKLDPEELRALLGRYHDKVAEAVRAHDGYVAKLLGDGVLAYFGWPNAHEDDAERAVRAALAAVAATAEMEASGGNLAARAGIATGPVVVGDRVGMAEETGAVAGATPNLAARLQAAANAGEVTIATATRHLIGGAFDLEERGTVALKGFSDPVTIWRVRGPARNQMRFEAQRGEGLTRFVGRAHEIGLLTDRWRFSAAGEGQVVQLCGEAGIGKSRILRELLEALDADTCHVLRLQCSPHEVNAAFQPLIAEIEAAAGFEADNTAEEKLDRLEAHLAEIFDQPGLAPPILAGLLGLHSERYPQLDMGPQRRKQQIIETLCNRITRLAIRQPVVLFFEDIHWIDPSSLEVLDVLVDRIGDLPVLAVMTYRPEFDARWSGYGHVTIHSLNKLARGDARAIATRVAGGKALPDEVLDRIISRTDGIPLFVEELTKTVLEAGILRQLDDRYELAGPLPDLAIPETLQDSLMARLDRLAPVKRVVQAAACIGREFDASILAAALRLEESEIATALDQLVEAELIFRRGGMPNERFIFKHALVQDAAYASLLTPARRSIHERLAMALEDADEPDLLELARHFTGAGNDTRAAQSYLSAGQQLLMGNALPESIGALELGLASAAGIAEPAEREPLEFSLRVALGTARMANFGWAHPSVAEAFEPAFPRARATADKEALGTILWGLWVHYQTRTNFPQAHKWLAELEAVADEYPASDLPLVFGMSAGCQHFWEAEYGDALRHTDHLKSIYNHDQHSRITSLTNHDPLVFSQHWAGSLADWIGGHPERSLERLDEAVSLARDIGHPFNRMFALTAGSTNLIYLNETGRMLDHCNEAETVVEEEALGPFSLAVCVHQWRGAAHILRGDYEVGYPISQEGNAFWNASEGRICNAMMRSWIVLGLLGLERIEDAATLNEANIAHCRQSGDCYMEPECLRIRGELMLKADRPDVDKAERSFREAIAVAHETRAKSWELRASMSLARLLQSRDCRKEAIAILEPSINWFREGLETHDLKQVGNLLAALD